MVSPTTAALHYYSTDLKSSKQANTLLLIWRDKGPSLLLACSTPIIIWSGSNNGGGEGVVDWMCWLMMNDIERVDDLRGGRDISA
uniref:Uncharacterized protein n=1 Tax=Ditylenchus dipsaci TaxID=166011 RepID=A0A915E7K5_9BILA